MKDVENQLVVNPVTTQVTSFRYKRKKYMLFKGLLYNAMFINLQKKKIRMSVNRASVIR